MVVCKALEEIVEPSIQRTTDPRKLRSLRSWCGALRDYTAECESVLSDVCADRERERERDRRGGGSDGDRDNGGRKRQRRAQR